MSASLHVHQEQAGRLLGIAEGDRDKAAHFFEDVRPLVVARVRRRMSKGVRRLFDSMDIMATLSRRFDALVSQRSVEALSEGQLIALLTTMAQHAVIDKARVVERLNRTEGEDTAWASGLMQRIHAAQRPGSQDPDSIIAAAFEAVDDALDKEILALWLRGIPQSQIAEVIGLPDTKVWWRWSRIRKQLKAQFESEDAL